MDPSSARFEALKRRIAKDKFSSTTSTFVGSTPTEKFVTFDEEIPLYRAPSDFINEFGRVLSHLSALHLETDLASHAKLSQYMKRRFPERLLQCRALASSSAQLYTSWRSRTRKREAEWGDPEDLGIISTPANSVHFTPSFTEANAKEDEGEADFVTTSVQVGAEPKFLLPSFFVPVITTSSSRLYYLNQPTLTPSNPLSLFSANSAIWSPSERKIFIELYLQFPKNFARIAANLPNKSCEQCVEFYYRHKKEYKLKQMVASYRKAMVAQRKMIPNSSTTTSENLVIDDDSGSANSNLIDGTTTTTSNNSTINRRKTTGRPVGRPKNKDKDK